MVDGEREPGEAAWQPAENRVLPERADPFSQVGWIRASGECGVLGEATWG